ncbi:MAG: hypothetical protein RL367_195 [Pseudomonadota bacterium]
MMAMRVEMDTASTDSSSAQTFAPLTPTVLQLLERVLPPKNWKNHLCPPCLNSAR